MGSEILIIESVVPCEQCRKAKAIAMGLAQKYEGMRVKVINVLDPEAEKIWHCHDANSYGQQYHNLGQGSTQP